MRAVLFFILFFSTSAFAETCDFIQFNACTSCKSPHAFSVLNEQTCLSLCPERIFKETPVGNGVSVKTCALKKCPAEFPFQSVYGSCFKSHEETLSDDGEVVTNNVNDSNIKDIFEKHPTCPKEIPLRRWDGSCFSCNEEQTIYLESACNSDTQCESTCPNRTILYSNGGNIPSVLNCPKEMPLLDEKGICHPCDTLLEIPFELNSRLCHQFCPDSRHIKNGKCVLK